MKAIPLWQPWASLWLSPAKIHETRHWPVQRRWKDWKSGDLLAVHAAKQFEKDHPTELAAILRDQFGSAWYRDLPRGAIIGAVELVACRPTESVYRATFAGQDANFLCGNFAPNRFAWERGRYWQLVRPQPWKGSQGMFEIPDHLFFEQQRTERGP